MADMGTIITANTIIPQIWDAEVISRAYSSLEKYTMKYEPKKAKPLVVILVDK